MQANSSYIDLEKIRALLYDDDGFIQEFSAAAIESFQEFSDNYKKHLLDRNEPELRKTGHKLKPVALMIGVDEVVEEYETAKTLLHDEASDEELKRSVERAQNITSTVITELRHLSE